MSKKCLRENGLIYSTDPPAPEVPTSVALSENDTNDYNLLIGFLVRNWLRLKSFLKRINYRKLLIGLLILIIVPATILFGVFFLNDRKYYFVSLLIIIYTLIVFVMGFENRKPEVREIIVVSVLSAIAVASRAAFFMLPQFKPVVAIVIISAVCFGAESGFLVGAVSGFVSNFFFGQGPWTPWQMFCFGIIGFIAGILSKKGLLKKTKLSLCVFGGVSTFFVYGGIINIGSLLMFTSKFSFKALIATYISGFWFDMVHAIATVFFLFIISQPMIEKLERIKTKYGLMDSSASYYGDN